jgi:hypothetical protein
MSDDLVKDLRFWNGGIDSDKKMQKAADRIEKLEAALREIVAMDTPSTNTKAKAAMVSIARKALEGKDD